MATDRAFEAVEEKRRTTDRSVQKHRRDRHHSTTGKCNYDKLVAYLETELKSGGFLQRGYWFPKRSGGRYHIPWRGIG